MSITLAQGLGLAIMAIICGIDFWLEGFYIFRPIIVSTLTGIILGDPVLGMATEVPALANGIDGSCGSIVPGRDADVVILNADLTLDATYVGGSLVR